MAKIVITIEDVDGFVSVDLQSDRPMYKGVSPQNTEAQNLGAIAMLTVHANVKLKGGTVKDLPDVPALHH